jgi:hypothetical protein
MKNGKFQWHERKATYHVSLSEAFVEMRTRGKSGSKKCFRDFNDICFCCNFPILLIK